MKLHLLPGIEVAFQSLIFKTPELERLLGLAGTMPANYWCLINYFIHVICARFFYSRFKINSQP
jgi:hypothetical protein